MLSHSVMSDSLQHGVAVHGDCSPPDCSVHWDSPGKNTGMGCNALLQGIFPTQGLHPGLQHCRQILYRLSHQGRLNNLAHYHWKLNTIFIYLFIYLFIWSCCVFGVADGIFSLRCDMWTLACGRWDLVPWPGIEPGPPALGTWSLSHRTTRKSQDILNLDFFFFF